MKRAILLLVLVLAGCGRNPDRGWLGYVEGEDAFVSAPQSGWIEKIAVQRGDPVKRGDLLFVLDDTDQTASRDQALANIKQADAQLRQARANLAYATKELNRQRKLLHSHAGTQQNFDLAKESAQQASARISQIEAQQQQLQAALTQADYRLSQRDIVARTSGRVEDIYFRAGEFAPAMTPVVSILPPKNIYVRFFVPETQFAHVKLGQTVSIHCDGCAKNITAKITFIAQKEEFTPPVIFSVNNRQKLVFKLEARAPGGLHLNPGQPVTVRPVQS
jgi:HlyD family secretion protein